jgi:predicted branched-subunit amino acid permease
MSVTGARPDAAYWSHTGFVHGVRLALAPSVGLAVFAAAFGALAAQKGLSLLEAALMSALVYAGASQFVGMEIWTQPVTASLVVTLGLVTAVVNMRFLLMSASLRPWLGALPSWQTYPALGVLVEPAWLVAARYRAEGGSDAGVYLGAGLFMWATWVPATAAGHLLGTWIGDITRFGLDVVLPAFFVVMLVPMWRGAAAAVPWAVAGLTALLVAALVPGWWFIVAGAIAGSVIGGLTDGE